MYKFVTVKGSCGNPYDVNACEQHANTMGAQGYELVQVYQTAMGGGCCTGPSSVLVMVFKKLG